MSDMTSLLKDHPLAVGGAVVAVAIIAYLQSRNNGSASTSSQGESFAFSGESVAAPLDPGVVAIEQSAIAAGTSNFGTVAQLVGLQDSNRTALTSSLATTEAQRTVALAGNQAAMFATEAGRDVSLANIAASLRASLFQTEATRDTNLYQTRVTGEVSDRQTDAGLSAEQMRNAVNLQAYQISADTQRRQIDAQREAAILDANNRNFAIQADKDKARAQDNTDLVSGLFKLGASLLAFL
jgi:hypothetical protein